MPALVLLYFGPEVLMPVLSALAAAVGAVLIVGKRILHWFRTAGRWIAGLFGGAGRADAGESDAPEVEGSASAARGGRESSEPSP